MRWLAALLLVLALPVAAKSFYVPGAGGVPLAVMEAGDPAGPEILFLHGLGQGKESFLPQLEADALAGHRMVAFDLRGHGMSGKPWREADYADPAVWAGDVKAVMQAAGLKKPVIVAWSYGALVAADYVRVFGTGEIAGLVLISSLGGLVEAPPADPEMVFPPELVRVRELVGVPELGAQAEYGRVVVPMLAGAGASPMWKARAEQLALMVPAYAQPLLRAHGMDNGDLLARIDVPLLFVHGGFEVSFSSTTVAALLARSACARASAYVGQGHAPFAEVPARFNADLAAFVAAARSGCGQR
jgi:pimeloyl-ACP methyl ester carboxylesterase